MISLLSQTWPWYVSGPLIALVMILLLWAGGEFGVSSSLRTLCSIGGAGKKIKFFDFNWKGQTWNLVFVIGAILGGVLSQYFLQNNQGLDISNNTISALSSIGIQFDGKLLPGQLFDFDTQQASFQLPLLIFGGFMVGFGARWAGGCTSGHAISGLSNLQIASLIAVVGFFIGGLLMTHVLFPYIF